MHHQHNSIAYNMHNIFVIVFGDDLKTKTAQRAESVHRVIAWRKRNPNLDSIA